MESDGLGATSPSTASFNFAPTTLHPQSQSKSAPQLWTLPEDAFHPAEGSDLNTFRVVLLNLGSRNTNPLEFEMKGDNSEVAAEAVAILRRAGKAMKSAQEGPRLMPESEMEVVRRILAQIFQEWVDEAQCRWHSRIRELLQCETWAQVLSSVQETSPHLFNAFNLDTLKLNRPSVWENPSSCAEYTNTKGYLLAWMQWYSGLDRTSQFWLEHAPHVANKRGLEVPAFFAGLLLFDVMCLCTARVAMSSGDQADGLDDVDARAVPFKEIARFASALPASRLTARYTFAANIAQGAHALLAQEAHSFADHPGIEEEFSPPFCAGDGLTAVFLRKDSFSKAIDIRASVVHRMEQLIDAEGSQDKQRAWITMLGHLAAVFCECHPQIGAFRACLLSLHAPKSDYTAGFVTKLQDVLVDYDADINALGMVSNCETKGFQKTLLNAGFDIGCKPKRQQVTVAKQRTAFQTQAGKVGSVDISHKDYILTWGSSTVRRGRTKYTPDLRTSYAVEHQTKHCVRLPTTQWPFDHCSVATSFQQKFACKDHVRCSLRCCCACIVATLILLVFLAPLASGDRASPYGQPGQWFQDGFIATPRLGICEASAPCLAGWVEAEGSCYTATPKLGFPDVQRFCERMGGVPVTIDSEKENQLMLESLCPKDEFCYIGLLGDYATRANYWISGESLNYTQLVVTEKSMLPLFESSRSTEYLVTMLCNRPAKTSGCDVSFTSKYEHYATTWVDGLREYVLPAVAMVVSGVLLVQPRPRQQCLPSALLLLSFCVNFPWALLKMFNACFVDDFYSHSSAIDNARLLAVGGIASTSVLGLWMITRRMCILYPSGAFKKLFWASFTSVSTSYAIISVFLNTAAPFAATWAVLLALFTTGSSIVLYLVIAVRSFRCLHHTYECLHSEATSGRSTRGTTLKQVRAAKFHLVAVPLATFTGAVRWAAIAVLMVVYMHGKEFTPTWGPTLFALSIFLDSITNDFCTHVMVALNMDEAVVHAKGVTTEMAQRAETELEQHRLAVKMLKAAPTSMEQLHEFAILEGKAIDALGGDQEVNAFMMLQSAVRVETARIHRLMQCVRMRAMTMQMRYRFLIDVPTLDSTPRQHVPEKFAEGERSEATADQYFDWLYAESGDAQSVFFQRLQQLVRKFNCSAWPSDLGLAPEEFSWRIWAGSEEHSAGMQRLQKGEVVSPGSMLIHSPARRNCVAPDPSVLCTVLEETSSDRAVVHRSGMESPAAVSRNDLRSCQGGVVFIPGPQKKRHRCLDKIGADYVDSEWPAASRLVDICRCMLLCDDPYAMAVLVAYLRDSVEVVRLKNRFSEDALEVQASMDLQSMFYMASSSDSTTSERRFSAGDKQYRDISMNVVIPTHNGVPFVCEIQVTLASLAILKHADTELYTIRRMKSPAELASCRTFDKYNKDNARGSSRRSSRLSRMASMSERNKVQQNGVRVSSETLHQGPGMI